MSHFYKLLDTLPVCQDFNRSMCSRLNCRFVHLTEDDKVEVCDQRVAVCRDHANGQCRRKLCKYYHIPVALPPANIMATIFNQQPAQQPLNQQYQLEATSTISSNQQQEEQLNKQQLAITKNTTRATPTTYTSLSNHNNNNNLMNSLSNNILYTNVTEQNNNKLLSLHQHNTMSPPLSRQISSTTNSFSAAQHYALDASPSPSTTSRYQLSNVPALTTSTKTIPTPVVATTATNVSAVAIAGAANTYNNTPTFQRFLKTQQLITPTLGYYDIINHGLNHINTNNCFTLLSSNPTFAAAPMLYPSATQHQNQASSSINIKNIQLSTNIATKQATNTPNLPAVVTTSTK